MFNIQIPIFTLVVLPLACTWNKVPFTVSGFTLNPSQIRKKFKSQPKYSSASLPLKAKVETISKNEDDATISIAEKNINLEYDLPVFQTLSDLAVSTLYQSDLKRDAKGKNSGAQGSSATNWIDDATSFALKSVLDKMQMKLPDEVAGSERDETIAWTRWMKSSPTPLVVDLTHDFVRCASNAIGDGITEAQLTALGTNRKDFFSRISCKMILLPSGAELTHPLIERTGTIVFGKLLYGGVSRYRLLGSSTSNRPARRVGEQTVVKSAVDQDVLSWVQFGGTERKYEAVDMGSCAIFEISLSGKKEEPSVQSDENSAENKVRKQGEMMLTSIDWDPIKMFSYSRTTNDVANDVLSDDDDVRDKLMGNSAMNLGGRKRNEAFANNFKSAVGGLDSQIEVIVRRVLDGRVIRPVDEDSGSENSYTSEDNTQSDDDSLVAMTDGELSQAALEADELALLGLTPVRGLLLYGPPGCGKTALAREISAALRARSPKILSAPELLDRWVGSSEKLIRQLFSDAEAELTACNGDATKSALHVIVIDEIDAVFRKRTSAEDSGEATRSSAVNQILAKLDGVNAIPNVLLIGMTNRRELLDPALLRPGRLEVQILVPKPDTEGRREILNIHFDALRAKGRLSRPLCCAIDGIRYEEEIGEAVDSVRAKPAPRKRDRLKNIMIRVAPLSGTCFDLAASTEGYSGADLAGLVRCAGSIALARAREAGSGVNELFITLDDVKNAMKEIQL